ncbi:methionyl-tRNA formyltransferase [Yunchengibacter salinarum]|uniref:methionyl-tRNA formyltransferase n=1 Tax=Yunchengibacter salinarum TaxID=3133399 RepID=UPI0035B61661
MRLAFMGTPDFAVPTLKALIGAGHEIAAVYTQPPARAGRGKALSKSPVHREAETAGIDVFTPASLKSKDVQADFADMALDAAVVVAYGQILPKAVLQAPRLGCINVHASLLPRWRGAAPIHRAVMAGDRMTGITIMQMDKGLDTGPILARQNLPIGEEDTTGDLHDRLALLGAAMIGPVLSGLQAGSVSGRPQPEEGVTYAPKIDKTEAAIDWSASADAVSRLVRGLAPFPGAWSVVNDTRLKILGGTVEPASAGAAPGTVLDDGLLVACGDGAFRITRAQRPGKGMMDGDILLRGFPVSPGAVFSRSGG